MDLTYEVGCLAFAITAVVYKITKHRSAKKSVKRKRIEIETNKDGRVMKKMKKNSLKLDTVCDCIEFEDDEEWIGLPIDYIFERCEVCRNSIL
jgi:hypothetical protein